MSEINLLWAFDTLFWKMAAVSINSALVNLASGVRCNVYCMVAPRTDGYRQIKKIVAQYPGAKLIWRPVKSEENPFRSHDYSRWSPVIFYRLFACNIFKDVDKMLYLDSDTLICGDLIDLYNTDISQYAIGGIRDMAPVEDLTHPNGKYVHDFMTEHLHSDIYINSGVVLINMAKMASMMDDMLRVDVKLTYPDQDILNIAFDGKIKTLPLRYNFAPGVGLSTKFVGADASVTMKNATILHFYSGKPYLYSFVPRDVYSAFYNACRKIGMHPEDFITHEERVRASRYSSRTVIPWVRITRNAKLKLFGITIK